jgi:hypothetical protein
MHPSAEDRGLVFLVFCKQQRFARRQAALGGDTSIVPLAATQPVPTAEALSLPFTIKTRPNWLTIISTCGLAALALWGLFEGMLLQYPDLSGASVYVPISFIVAMLFFGILIFAIAQTSRQHLEVTPDSLMRTSPDFQRMPWNQIKLFAIAPGGSWSKPPKRYELASSSYSFPLRRLRRRDMLGFSIPATSFIEYNHQIVALLSLIAAKTGLPLYDLREPGSLGDGGD